MPTKLPNGIEIVNLTPHPLIFWHPGWCQQEVVAESDGTLNSKPIKRFHSRDSSNPAVHFTTVEYSEKKQGRQLIDKWRKECPDALIVASIVAAQAYPEEVYAPITFVRQDGRHDKSPDRRCDPFNFTVFTRRNENGIRTYQEGV